MFKHNLLTLLLCLMSSMVISQVTIKGEIIDEGNGEPLIGANVVLKDDPSKGTITDWDGSFALKVPSTPVVLNVSYIGYIDKDITITNPDEMQSISLGEDAVTIDIGIEVTGQRVSDKQKAAPLTVETMDILAIKETASENFYDGLGAMKGVDLTAASLGFKIINTRGFNSTSPVRSLQIIDGVDNQSPGLNFSLGNFLGSSDLDVLKVDLIQGASSAFYGPNAFNGVISMETKNPFYQKGLSAKLKVGERNLFSGALRWADTHGNKDGDEVFGYKLNFFYLRADDWEADNFEPVFDTNTGVGNPGGFDAVNIYGDEARGAFDQRSASLHANTAGLGQYHRRGYQEADLVDYDTRNLKANVSLHLRTKPSAKEQSPELIFSSSYSNGTTVYQGDNRFSLKNIQFFQNRLEFRKKDKYFIRAYATSDDAGDSYDPFFTSLRLQESAKDDVSWNRDYANAWIGDYRNRMRELGYPELERTTDPNGGILFVIDTMAALNWLTDFSDSLTVWHSEAQGIANSASGNRSFDFFEPGTARFDSLFNQITGTLNNEFGGTRFHSRSDLYHLHGEYKITPSFVDEWIVGANGRLYTPESRGTIFFDSAGISITNWEVGAYTGLTKKFADDRLTASATIRVDKNQNFDLVASPAASLVWKPKAGNFFRLSFSSAIRNPTLSDQYLSLNVGPAILSGNLDGVQDLITVESFVDTYLTTLNTNDLVFFDIDPIQPEKVKSVEAGYRTTLFNSLFVDGSYYYSVYDDFLGFNLGIDAEFGGATNLPTFIQAFRYAANSSEQVTTQGFAIGLNYYFADYFQLSGNYSWNKLNTELDDPIIPAFNTPEHKYNIGFSGRSIPVGRGLLGYNINYKWIEGFLFEGSPQFTGLIPSYNLVDVQVNYFMKKWNTTFKLGASNILDNQQFQAYGGPRIGRLAYLSATYEFKK